MDFAKEWMPRVSVSLKSLSLLGFNFGFRVLKSNVLPLISFYCLVGSSLSIPTDRGHNLVNLKLKFAWFYVDHLNPMPMLTSLTLECSILEDQHLDRLNKCFPNFQVLNLVGVKRLKNPKIHLLKLQTCHWAVYDHLTSLTLITPNLITLKIESLTPIAIHAEAPMLSHFQLHLSDDHKPYGALTTKKFENLKTLWLDSIYIGSLLSEFLITKSVQELTLDSGYKAPRDPKDSKLTLRKVFTIFPNLSSLCIKSSVWTELEAFLNPEGWDILDGSYKGLKTICAYLMLADPSLTFSYVACVLDQCVGLSLSGLAAHPL